MLFAAIAAMGGISAGCSEAPPQIGYLPAEGEELPILRQKTGTHSTELTAMQLVVREEAELARIPLTDIDVDFEQEMLLIVLLGRVPSDQYAVRIERVWREGRNLAVKTLVQRPGTSAPLSLASPWCVAVVPRCDLRVEGFATEPPPRKRTWGQSETGF